MYSLKKSTILTVILLGMLAGLVAGCGGTQSGNGSQDGEPAGNGGAGGQAAEENAPPEKIAIGMVRRVDADGRMLIVKPSRGGEDAKPIPFKIAENATITVEGQKSGVDDIEKGQQAQISYIVVKERNRARDVKLFDRAGQNAGDGGEEGSEGGEKTAQ